MNKVAKQFASDWFTLSPAHRTRKRLAQQIQEALDAELLTTYARLQAANEALLKIEQESIDHVAVKLARTALKEG